jgi:hypothetical protein
MKMTKDQLKEWTEQKIALKATNQNPKHMKSRLKDCRITLPEKYSKIYEPVDFRIPFIPDVEKDYCVLFEMVSGQKKVYPVSDVVGYCRCDEHGQAEDSVKRIILRRLN